MLRVLLPVMALLGPGLTSATYLIGRGVADSTGVIAEGILVRTNDFVSTFSIVLRGAFKVRKGCGGMVRNSK